MHTHLRNLILNHLLRLLQFVLSLLRDPLNLSLRDPRVLLGLGPDLFPARRPTHIPVVVPSVALRRLGAEVDEVAGEEEVVLGGYGEGVPHEDCGVAEEGDCEFSGDAVGERG